MPKYDPWNKSRLGFARNDAPAFQREFDSFNPSAVELDNVGAGNTQTLIESPSATYDMSGTLYIWGISFCTGATTATGGKLLDDDDNPVGAVVGTSKGPYFLKLSSPIKLPKNSSLKYEQVIHNTNSFVTPYYVVETEQEETEI